MPDLLGGLGDRIALSKLLMGQPRPSLPSFPWGQKVLVLTGTRVRIRKAARLLPRKLPVLQVNRKQRLSQQDTTRPGL